MTLSQTKPKRPEKKDTPPPVTRPPTPTLATLPPRMASPRLSSFKYTSAQRFPGPMLVVFRSAETSTCLKAAKSMVTPPGWLAAPFWGVCPPPLMPNLHSSLKSVCLPTALRTKTAAATSLVEVGSTTQFGMTASSWADQKEAVVPV